MDLLDDDALIDLRRRARSTDAAAVVEEERRQRQGKAIPPLNLDSQKPAPTPSAAIPPGMCGLCATRVGRGTCTNCGRLACAADLWIMLRLCRDCASDQDVARGQRGAQPESRNWLEGRQ